MPDITRADGVFNFTAYFGLNANKPDLGRFLLFDTLAVQCSSDLSCRCLHLTMYIHSCPGPKLYIAQTSKDLGQHSGSTFVHKDVTSAYNVALDIEENEDGTPGFALWHIWPPWSSKKLEQYILKKGLALAEDGSPIHGQRVYLDENHIQEMSAITGLKPFTIQQRKGDAVFIPANCAHQVRVLNVFKSCYRLG